MKMRVLSLSLASFLILALLAASPCSAAIIGFDDFPESANGSFIPNGYQSLNWSNFAVGNGILLSNVTGYANGYYYGIVSASNVALNADGEPSEIDSATDFSFLSAYFTGAWNSNLNIEVQGFRSGTLIYDQTVAAAATNATLFMFNYADIDRLYFNSFGGEPAFGGTSREQFVMDNLDIEFIPEPSSLLLTGFGAASLFAFLRRKRV